MLWKVTVKSNAFFRRKDANPTEIRCHEMIVELHGTSVSIPPKRGVPED